MSVHRVENFLIAILYYLSTVGRDKYKIRLTMNGMFVRGLFLQNTIIGGPNMDGEIDEIVGVRLNTEL